MAQPPFNTSTLGGFAIQDPPERYGRPVNLMVWRSGASRFGVGRFLLARDDWNELIDGESFTGTADLVLTGGPDTSRNVLKITVRLASYSVAVGGAGDNDDLIEAVVYDTRADNITPIQNAYNAIQEPIAWSTTDSDFAYYPSTKNGSSAWTWAQIFSDLSTPDFPTLSNPPSWKPRNLVFDEVPTCRVIDEIAARLFLVVGWDGDKLSFCTPGNMNGHNTSLLQYAQNQGGAQIGGGDGDREDHKLPGIIRCVFRTPASVNDPFDNRFYEKDIDVGGGTNTGSTQALHLGDVPAIPSGATTWANQTDMDAIASDMADRFFTWLSVTPSEYVFGGIWNFQLDGAIRQIEWSTDCAGARTRIVLNNERHFSPIEDLMHSAVLPSNQFAISTGGSNVSLHGGSGSRFVWGTNPTMFAKLTSRSGTLYAWQQAQLSSSGTWSVVTGGASGTTTDNPAVDLNSGDTADLTNEFVVLVRAVGTDGKPCWVIVSGGAGIPQLQHQYMVIEAVTVNQMGGDWPRLHPTL